MSSIIVTPDPPACARCKNPGDRYPRLNIGFAPGALPGKRFQIVIDVPACRQCSRMATVADLLGDDNWKTLSGRLFAFTGQMPDRKSVSVEWIDWRNPQVGDLAKARRAAEGGHE